MAKVYYNDMLLPDKPNDLPSEYVYAIIQGSGNEKWLRVSTSVWYFYSTTDFPSTLKSSASSCYAYKLNGDEWELTDAAYSTYIYVDTAKSNTIVWSSDNIPNGSENATAVYFYGNAAIPEDSSGNAFLKYRLVIPDFRRGLTSKAPATYANLAEFAVYDSAGTNLALLDGATYKANTYTSDHPTSYAFDGSTTTYWHSDWVNTPNTINWLEVRLPGFVAYDSYKAVSVGLTPQPESSVDFPWMFYILGCNNESDWRLISSFNPRADGWESGVERIFELPSSEMYTLTRTRLTEFADEVRRLTETTDVLTPAGMLSGLRSVEVGSGGGGGNTLVVTCTTGSTVTCSKDGETKTATEENGTWTFTGLTAGVWTVTATLDESTATSEVEIVDSALTLRYPEMVSWADGTDEQIAVMIDAAKAGRIDLQTDGGWAVGDKRTISIAAFTGGGDVAHEAQEIDIVISSFEDYNSCGCIMQFDFAEALASGGRMNSTNTSNGGYGSSEMYLTTIPALVEALPSWLKERLVEFSVLAANNGGNASIVTVTGNKLALRSEVEVTGRVYSKSGEGTQIPYYATTENRIKNRGHGGEANSWWERSVSASADYFFMSVSAAGGADYTSANKELGIAPFGCI